MSPLAIFFFVSITISSLFSTLGVEVSYQDTIPYENTIMAPWMDSFDKKPNVTLYVCFKEDSCVVNGDTFGLKDTIEGPYVTLIGSELNEKDHYVYVCVDIDADNPRKPYAKNQVHWLVANIVGSIQPYQHVADVGKTVVPYLQPHKDFFYKGDYGTHRYYNLVFKQSIAGQNVTFDGDVRHFSVRKFVRENNLGYPMAGVLYKIDYNSKSD
ncbi:hypothetical protein GOP47_0012696 [Adiantum capillus-veneris]|uniref:Uncharacterized protein n=1 Tax=Adiantum capillus-veneris TaxID=13818 RepID=A0A9D4URJ1_ADICA|nr:hypothetical protein GOP47_0012696 [Adiantum capillus-veneris]